MSSGKHSEAKLREIQEIAQSWGRLLAREAFPDGPGLDVSLAEMEDVAAMATRAMVRGAVEEMTKEQAGLLGAEARCPTCGTSCELKRKARDIIVRGGTASLDEPVAHCGRCRRDFFPSA